MEENIYEFYQPKNAVKNGMIRLIVKTLILVFFIKLTVIFINRW